MTVQFARDDLLPIRSCNPGADENGRPIVKVVLEKDLGVQWTVLEVQMKDGQPRVTRYAVAGLPGADVDVLHRLGPAPLRTLAAIWARCFGLGSDGQLGTFDLLKLADDLMTDNPHVRKTLGRKPDARREKRDPDGYAEAMREWTAPIAEVIRDASAQMSPIQAAVKTAFSVNADKPFSDTYAERLVSFAREYHGLPKRGPDDTTKTPKPNRVRDK